MEILHKENGDKGAFHIEQEGKKAAEMTYVKNGDTRMIIDHTEVDSAFKGEGYGKALVFHSAEFAREHHLKVLPLCPFAKALYHRYEELQDVL